ncbi:MAG: hypothetical protein M3220_11115 [Chloroflexota bacterium]|nr:hypothetical protein [Chloroflexota bacterium]
MATPLEETTRELIAQLTEQLAQNEDAESAIDVYKRANWIISQLDEVKDSALELAQQDMEARGLEHLKTPAGSAGWTEPRARQLNEQAWMAALAQEPRFMRLQREFDAAEAALRQAQEPYQALTESRFFIR